MEYYHFCGLDTVNVIDGLVTLDQMRTTSEEKNLNEAMMMSPPELVRALRSLLGAIRDELRTIVKELREHR